MAILSGYDQINVHLIDPVYGCTPWAIEWMIRYKANVSGIWEIPTDDLDFFQYKYNLHEQTGGDIQNTYINILEMVREFHPNISLVHCNTYGNGQAQQKYQRIDQLIGQGIPCITTIRLSRQDNAHIVPVTEVRPDNVWVIWNITFSGHQDIRPFSKTSLFQMHDAGRGRAFMYLP